jgi:hypothetical protein
MMPRDGQQLAPPLLLVLRQLFPALLFVLWQLAAAPAALLVQWSVAQQPSPGPLHQPQRRRWTTRRQAGGIVAKRGVSAQRNIPID